MRFFVSKRNIALVYLCLTTEVKQVQTDFFVAESVDRAVYNGNDKLACCADTGTVQMTAENLALFVACAHMQMRIELTVHCIYGSDKRHYLISPVKFV